jgi:hypothetical protein
MKKVYFAQINNINNHLIYYTRLDYLKLEY